MNDRQPCDMMILCCSIIINHLFTINTALYPSFCPVASVKVAVADGLGYVHRLNTV